MFEPLHQWLTVRAHSWNIATNLIYASIMSSRRYHKLAFSWTDDRSHIIWSEHLLFGGNALSPGQHTRAEYTLTRKYEISYIRYWDIYFWIKNFAGQDFTPNDTNKRETAWLWFHKSKMLHQGPHSHRSMRHIPLSTEQFFVKTIAIVITTEDLIKWPNEKEFFEW